MGETGQSRRSEKIFIETKDFKEEFERVNIECNREMSKLGANILYDFVIALPNAEKEVYKCLGKIYGKNVSEIESQELDETIDQIKKISQSKTVMGFFNLAIR